VAQQQPVPQPQQSQQSPRFIAPPFIDSLSMHYIEVDQ
jgi:hypothetical protein